MKEPRVIRWVLCLAVLVAASVCTGSASAIPPGGYHELEDEGIENEVAPDKPPTPSCQAISASTNPCGYNILTLSVGQVTSRSVELSWKAVNGPESYYVVEQSTGDGSFAEIARLGGEASSYSRGGLTPGLRYGFRVRSTTSTVSNAVVARTAIELEASQATTRSVRLRWSGAVDATAYVLERRLAYASTGFAQIETLAQDAREWVDRGLSYNTNYEYRIRATGAEVSSNIASARTLAPQVDRVVMSPWSLTQWTMYRGQAGLSVPADAQILSVRNVSRDMYGNGLRVDDVKHQSQSLPKLNYLETTAAFNGGPARGGWELYLPPGTAKQLLWVCVENGCSHKGQVVLEVTWV